MQQPPKTSELAALAGISLSYASEITNGHKQPPRSLAIFVLRKIGWRYPVIAGLSDDDMAVIERLEPWTPPSARSAA